MCFEMAFNETSKGAAIWVTVAGLRASPARIERRVGSATAEKTRSKIPLLYSTIWLNISPAMPTRQGQECKIAVRESVCQTGTWNDE